MRKRNDLIFWAAVIIGAPVVVWGFGLPLDLPVEVGGRFEYGVVVDKRSAMFPWNYSSGELNDRTRLMLELETGSAKYGHVYLKGAADWNEYSRYLGEHRFELEQGDYFWHREGPDSGYAARIFANERRYFFGELSEPMLDDDIVVRYQDTRRAPNYGIKFDGVFKGGVHGSAVGSILGRDWGEGRKFCLLRTFLPGRFVQASAAYLLDAPGPDSLDNHAVIKGEIAAIYKKMSLVLSFEQSGLDDKGLFLPSGRVDWDGFVGNNFSSILPGGAAVFGEMRLAGLPFRELGYVTFVHRYRTMGREFYNDLGTTRRAEASSSSGLYFAARKVALDGRLVYSKSARWRFGKEKREKLEAGVRASLKNGSEVILRGALAKTFDHLPYTTKENFIHAALRRSGRKIASGVHVMAKDIDDGEFLRRFAVETRMNWTTEIAFYCRVVLNDEAASHDAVFCRLELRPTDFLFATFAYGRDFIGDGPFLLEDHDIGRTGDTDAVYTFTLRGDF